ncbi:MAG: shikimate dehydrogenase [Actinomycetota bacterium]
MTRASGATRVAGVIGSPIRHSLSPVLHNAAFRALDLDWVFLAFEVAAGDGAAAVEGMRALRIEGLSVTMPHKADVLPALDLLSPTAEKLGAVNTVTRQGERLLGESTDGAGFLDALRLDEGFDPAGRRCLVFGAGGAARAVVLALAEAGASEVVVVNRSERRAIDAVALAGGVGRVGEAADAADAELVVNATSLGMDDGRTPLDPTVLAKGQLVVDLVYHPAVTPLVAGARAQGATAVNGLGMLIHQAAHAFRHWTGQEPPLAAMSAAALASMARSDVPKT